jgi:uncharacterized membrane protein
LNAIEKAIKVSETAACWRNTLRGRGRIGWHAAVQGAITRERALELFAQLRIWDTEHNNGLLIYLLLADRAVEIVADRGISQGRPSPLKNGERFATKWKRRSSNRTNEELAWSAACRL